MPRVFELEKVARPCVWAAATILALSGVFKVISALGSARILFEPDPIFGVANYQLFLWVGILEIGVVVALAGRESIHWKIVLLAALSTNFLIYRAGLWWLGVRKPCPCLGNAAGWAHIDPKMLDLLMKVALAWLLASSYGLLAMFSWRRETEGIVQEGGARASIAT